MGSLRAPSSKPRVFVSFDFDHDRGLKDLLIGQTKNGRTPFGAVDYTLKEARPQATWESDALRKIRASGVFLVLLGPQTRRAPGVLKEVVMAQNVRVQRGQLGRSPLRIAQLLPANGTTAWSVPNAGRVYRWTYDNMVKILHGG
jgi:hypothetical protein